MQNLDVRLWPISALHHAQKRHEADAKALNAASIQTLYLAFENATTVRLVELEQ